MRTYFLNILLIGVCAAANSVPQPVPRQQPQEKQLFAIGVYNHEEDAQAVKFAMELNDIKNQGKVKIAYHYTNSLYLEHIASNALGFTIIDAKSNQKEYITFYISEYPKDILNKWLYIERAYVRGDFVGLGVPVLPQERYKKYRLVTISPDSLVLYGSLEEGDTFLDPSFEVVREQGQNMQKDPKPGERMIAFAYKNYLFTRCPYLDDKDIWTHPDAKIDPSRKPQEYRLPSDDTLLMQLLREFVDIQHGVMSPMKNAKDGFERAWKSYSYQFTHNTDNEIRKFVTAVPQGQYAHDLYPDNSGSKRKKALGLKDGPIHNTIPNINEGKCTDGAVQSFIKQHPGYTRTYSEGGKVSYAATVQSTGNRIDYQIAHHVNPDQAMNMLFHFISQFPNQWSPIPESSRRYVRYTPGSGPLKSLGRVGDFDMPLKDYLTPDGMLIEGSDKSAVFFIRGNTAVGIQSVDPTVDVLPWAKEIDEKLKKNMEAATEKKSPPLESPLKQKG